MIPGIKKLKLLALFVFIASGLSAQFLLYEPIRDRIFRPSTYANIKGSPFLNENPESANVFVPKGVYQSVPVIYDVYSRKLFFQKDEELFEFAEPVLKFVLTPDLKDSSTYKYYVKGYESGEFSSNDFLEELVNGEQGLYKLNQVFIEEYIQFGVGLVKSFKHDEKYFLRYKSTFHELKFNKEAILARLKDKSEFIDAYVVNNKLSYKKIEDIRKILKYYNQLKTN